MSTDELLQGDLLAMSKGTHVVPGKCFAEEPNYLWRADQRNALRQRLVKLSLHGDFRMIDVDEWVRA